MKRFFAVAFLLAAAPLGAAPPKAPETVEVKVGDDYVLTLGGIESDDAFGMAPGFPPADCTFFEGVLRGGKKQFLVRPKKAGTFYVTWWTKGETAYSQTKIVGTGTVVPPVKPPTDPPVTPPPTSKLYFAVVRPDGNAAADFTAYMMNPGWTALRNAGHIVRDVQLSEAKQLQIPVGTTLPCVVTLVVGPDGFSTVVKSARPLPPPADIIKLPEDL